MFSLTQSYQPAFGGVILANEGQVADIELDGSGTYQGQRKMWRFRLVKGQLSSAAGELKIRLNNMIRPARITMVDGAAGFVELL